MRVFAPAKINLDLHITKILSNKYHVLDSLVAFTDIGDEITLSTAENFTFEINGPFAKAFTAQEHDPLSTSSNLAVKAAWAMARATDHTLELKITLTKNLPLGAGLGGGSANAAAVIWALLQWWSLPKDAPYLPELMIELGADVPVCFRARTGRMHGIGDQFDESTTTLPDIPVLLVYPGKACSTALVFSKFEGPLRPHRTLPAFKTQSEYLEFLSAQHNDLTPPAQKLVPEIKNARQGIKSQTGCVLARMSGSGSSSFGLFEEKEQALQAARYIQENNPDWWVKAGEIKGLQRY